jgi:predicted HD superfamily hydrolase involved in NAD metabolism
MKLNEIKKTLKKELDKSRYEHTLGVAYTAAAMAMAYEEDIDKAFLAGLLHDCAKCVPDNQKYKECKEAGFKISDAEKSNKFLLHSKLGSLYAREKYEISDKEVISAIFYHTTGKPRMTLLEKIIFTADYIEPNRNKAKNLSYIRKLAFEDLDSCVYAILRDTLEYLKSTSLNDLDETTVEAYEFYKKESKLGKTE